MKIGVIQLTSELDYQANLNKIKRFLVEAKNQNVEACFLPECFYSMSDGTKPTPHLVEEGNKHFENIRNLAIDHKMPLLGGSAAASVDGVVMNRNYNFDSDGNDLGHYDKIHLFSCDIEKDGKRKKIDEGDIYTPGNTPKLLKFRELKIGLGICFDLRFSQMAHQFRIQGANLLTFSSAFTIPTGKAHWHTLIRARAIENQCFAIAPAQWGRHNDKIQTFGHSLIVDPWGEVLADAEEGEKLIVAKLDFSRLEEVRQSVLMKLD